MAYATINKPNEHFAVNAYTGQNGSRDVTDTDNVNFTPDLVWIKHRQDVSSHAIFDSVRGVGKWLESDTTDAEATEAQSLTAFVDGGFSVGTQPNAPRTDESGGTPNHVAWMWRAGGSASSNTDGTITTQVSVNTTNGFSIATYTGNGSNGATVGHGLGATPDVVILRRRNGTEAWPVWTSSLAGNTSYLRLNDTDAVDTATGLFNSTTPNSSVVTLGTGGFSNTNTWTYVMYCMKEVKGYSKFGSYTGNGNADGPFIYTGFKPAMVIVKRTDTTNNWLMYDNKRNTYNVAGNILFANTSDSEDIQTTVNVYDFTSNGFKARSTYAATNASGGSYIYMAFAEAPLVGTNNIPATAR